ncbi:hypothetical protein HYC85_028123 [Camellia sinensis]|uniref:ABC transmembrane type-1 domain-containing protein n=1 Tax=Camellia sinensis TaxID=4442 RepID=A0A7J7FUE5_CAMSI|nr:hypothetical protein HYC85_028123 [Camellia sinensis]
MGDGDCGGLSWICEGEFDFITSRIQRTIIDELNLLFLLVFYLCLLICYLGKHNIKEWITMATSIGSALISIAYLSSCLCVLIPHGFIVHFVRGLIWISLTVSLLVQPSKWVKTLVSVWWMLFFMLISALNIQVFLRNKHNIQILDMVSWFVNLLLLFCALRNFSLFFCWPALDKGLSKPLLVEKPEKNCSIGHGSFLSKLTFSWINPLLQLDNSKILAVKDIPCLVPEDEAVLSYEKFANSWDLLRRENSSINARNLTLSAAAAPLLIYAFVNYSNRDMEKTHEGLILVGWLVVESLSQRHFFFNSRRIGMRMRSSLMVAIYQKQLKLSNLGRERHSTREVVNYIAIDAYRMGEFPTWFHLGWSLSLQLFLAILVLFWAVGLGALPSLEPLLITGLLNVPYAKLLQKCQFEFMSAQDKRLRFMSDIVNNMKIIKLQSWEDKFKNLIESY